MKKCTKAIAILLSCLMFFQMVPIFPMQVFAEDDTQAPSTPSGLTLISKTQTSVSFSWSESTDDIGVTSYIVFRDGIQIETSTTASFDDSSLSANTTYTYTVKASDAAGNFSAESEQLSVTTEPIPDTEVPSAPANLVMASKTNTSVSLTWDASTDNVGIDKYEIYCDGVSAGFSTTVSYTCTELNQGTTYSFSVKAYDAAGNVSTESEQLSVTIDPTLDTEAPSAPSNLTMALKTDTSVSLTWNASTDNVGVDKYEVYCDSVSAGFSTEASYTCIGLTQGTAYSFYVLAYDVAGNISSQSTAISVTTDDTQAPTAPANLRAVSRTGDTINLAWDAATDNIGIAGYEIYQGTELIGTTSGETSYAVTGLTEGTSYTFTVKARDSANNLSEASNTLSASTMPAIPGVPGNIAAMPTSTSISITWNEVPGATAYDIQFDGTTISGLTTTTYIRSNLSPNTMHSFKLLSKNESGSSEWSSTTDVWTLLQTPANFAVAQAKNLQTCTWNTVVNAEGYDIEVDGVIYDNGSSTTYINSGLVEGTNHTYRVRAKNSNTLSDWTVLISQVAIGYTAISGTISQDKTLMLEDSPYLVTGNLTVAQNVTMTVMPGVVLKFNPGKKLSIFGKVNAIGDEQNKIVFTTSKDAEFGGTGVTVAADLCGGFNVEATGELNGNYLSLKYGYCTTAYGYTPYNLAWSVYSVGSLNLSNSEVLNSGCRGILLRGNANAVIDSCKIDNSGVYGLESLKDANTTGTIAITNSNITNNKNYAVRIADYGNSKYNISGNNISNNSSIAICVDYTGANNLTINNNIISSNASNGIHIYRYNPGMLGEIRNNQINNNLGYPIYLELSYMSDSSILNNITGNTLSGNTSGNASVNSICIGGQINSDFVIPKLEDSTFIAASNLTIAQNAVVTIMPGVALMFCPGKKLSVFGKLNAIGDEHNKIIFTTVKDPDYGGAGVTTTADYTGGYNVESTGELNGNYLSLKYGYCTSAYGYSPYDIAWAVYSAGNLNLVNSEILNSLYRGILLRGNANVVIDKCKIDNSGVYGIDCLKEANTTGLIKITNSTISNNKNMGIHISSSGILGEIRNNQINGNLSCPIYFELGMLLNNSIMCNTTGNTYSGNVMGGIEVNAVCINGVINKNFTIPNNIPEYIVYYNGISIVDGSTLTIQPGILFRFIAKYCVTSGIDISNGKLYALGAPDKPIIFTSIKDTEFGGTGIVDSVWDHWAGINIGSAGELIADNIRVKYTGINYSYLYQIAISVGGKLSLTNSEISDTAVGIAYGENNTIPPVIAFNTFKRLYSLGIRNWRYYYYNDTSVVVDARYNYWDSMYGPGDRVAVDGCVNAYPYLGKEFKVKLNFGGNVTNPATGNFARQYTDLEVKSPGFDLNFGRSYNSMDDRQDSLLGRGWTFSFESSIKPYSSTVTYEDGTVKNYTMSSIKVVRLPDGSSQTFDANLDGSFTGRDNRNKLAKQADGTYVLTTKDQYSYYFDANGYIKSARDRNGNTITYDVDTNGRIHGITDQVGRTFSIAYNTAGHIESVTDPAGRVVTYEYENNLLARVIDPMGNVTRYSYDSEGFLNEVRDNESNLIESVVYIHQNGENLNKVDHTTDKNGNVLTYTYDNTNGRTVITDSNGRQTVKYYDASYCITNSLDPEGKSEITEYYKNSSGNNEYWEEKSVTDRNGNKTQYLRDSNGNVTQITNPDNSTKIMTYDSKNNVTSQKDENGKYTYFIYDTDGISLLKKVQPLNGTDVYVDGTSDVNQFAITVYTYYTNVECQQLGYTAKGLLKSVTDPEGKVITYTYDQWGNIGTTTDQEGKVTAYNYNNIGLKLSETNAAGFTTSYVYDKNGRLEKTTLHGGEVSRTTYDAKGNKLKEISANLYISADDDILSHTYTGDYGYRYIYYANGNLESVIDSENNTTSYTYDLYGNVQQETKPNGAIYRYEYDLINRLSKVYFKDNASAAEVLLEEYTYTILSGGKLKKTHKKYIDDTKTLVTSYTYDYAERLTEQLNPDGSLNKTAYNANGTINNTTDGNNNITYYKYDGLNRLTETWVPFEYSNNEIKYTYKSTNYDKAGNKTAEKTGKTVVSLWSVPTQFIIQNYTYFNNGKLKSAIDSEGRKTVYYYDDCWVINKIENYTDADHFNTIEYTNNYFGKPDEMRVHVKAGDIAGNDFSSQQDQVLITSYTYDKNGNVKTVTAPDQLVTTYVYDNLDRQKSVSQPGKDEFNANTIIINSTTYNWEGNPLTKTDSNGNTTTYSYGSRGFLDKTIDAKGGVTAYYYDRAGRKITVVSPQNYSDSLQLSEMSRTEYSYDAMDRIKTQTEIYLDTVSAQWITKVSKAIKYDNNGNVVKELDALGYETGTGTDADSKINSGYGTIYTYNYSNKLITVKDPVTAERGLSYTKSNTWDAVGRKTSETDAKGAITNYYYDDAGNVISLKVKKNSSSAEQTVYVKTYDWLGNMKTQTDGNGNITAYEYNALNKAKSIVYPGDATILQKTVIMQYYTTGNIAKQQDDTGITDLYTYDNQGRQLTHSQQKQDGTGNISTSVKYDPNGNKRFVTDGNSTTTEYVYDQLNRKVTEKITVDGVEHTTSFAYDKNSNLTTQTDWRGNVQTNIYDSLNRLIEKKDAYGKSIQKLEYDRNDKQTKSYDALGSLTQYTYDKNNRLLSTIDPLNHSTNQTYDNAGNVETQKDGLSNTTTYTYDEFNRLVNVKNAKNENTSYTFDLNGNKLTQTDGKGNITTFEYNAANKLICKIDHGGRTGTAPSYTYDQSKIESYTYYSDGSLHTKTDRNGETTINTYDIHGKLVSEAVGTSTISYTYDNNGNQLTMTDGTGTTTRTYDELGRVKTKDVPGIGTTTYIYDITTGVDTGCVAENTTDPKGNVTTKIYDRVGRLGSVTAAGKTTSYAYYDNGARQSVVYSSGAREDYTYYSDNLLQTLINKKADGTIIDSYTYNYNAAHNMTSKVDAKGTTSYTYDTLNRLLTVTEPGGKTTTYAYDAAGNRASETVVAGTNTTVTTYAYNTQNRLTDTTTKLNNVTTETQTFTYDNNGNELTVAKTPYIGGVAQPPQTTLNNTYDKFNQLITSVTAGGDSVESTYNGEGLRVVKTVNGQATNFLYEYDKVVLELDGNGNQTARNVYGTNLLMRNDGTNEYYYMYNGHSDVTALLKQDGTLAITYYYDAFGNIVEQGLIQEQNYSQNFDGSTLDGWTSYGGTWTLANGNYSVASYPGAKTVLNNTNLADFVYEADVKITSNVGDAGIIFRVSSPAVGADAYYGYYVGLDIWAQCVILGKAANSWTRLAASSMSIVSGQVYHVKVVAKGTSIKVYVNDMNTPKITVTNSSFASGSIGVRIYNSNATFDNVSVSNSVLVPTEANNTINYAGYQYDKETGLYYCNARMYDPKTARFLSEDTYRGDPNDPLSLNLYTYCHNEPLMYDDPTGHFPHLLAGAAIGFAIGAGVSMVSDAFSGNLSAKNWKNYLGAGVQGAIVGTVAAATGGANLIAMAGAGAAAGAVGNIANQSIRKAGTRKGIDAKELAVSTVASGIGFGAAGAISKVAASVSSKIASTIASKVLQKTVEGEMILQKTFEGGMIGSVGNASAAFAGNITDQTWDLANGNKKSFDFGSLGYETGIGALTGLGLGAALGNVFGNYGAGNSAGRASKTYFNELEGWSIGKTDAISNANTLYSRLSGPTAGDNTGINLKPAGASEVKYVNIDTGTANAFISEGSPIRGQLKSYVNGKQMVMTDTAVGEFKNIVNGVGGPLEQARAGRFLNRVQVIPDNPSARSLGLQTTKKVGANDIKIFGTGDNLGITTMTSDAKFIRGAQAQGVDFDTFIHDPVPLTKR